jgi:DNA polymerase-3 subunit alpha
VVSTRDDYIEKYKELGIAASAITEHGNISDWMGNLIRFKEAGIKYIFGIEAYMTWDISQKIRDNNHIILLAKNDIGRKEITRLSSAAWDRTNNSFYSKPRMSIETIMGTSENIIILTGCLASPIWQSQIKGSTSFNLDNHEMFVSWCVENKHRVFLEIQPHINDEQAEFNAMLKDIALKHDMKLVATGDFHAISPEHQKIAKVLQRSKGFEFDYGDEFDTWVLSYDEMVEKFKIQGVLSEQEILDALEQTNIIADMVSEYNVDMHTFKFPKMSDNPEEDFKKIINKGFKKVYKDKVDRKANLEGIRMEFEVFKNQAAIDWALLFGDIGKFAEENDILIGPGRGSACGSDIARVMGITDIDPIKYGLYFARFMNPDRVSLPDIDIDVSANDFAGNDQKKIQNFLITHPKLNGCSIANKNTLGMKSAVKAIAKGLGLPVKIGEAISADVIEIDADDPGSIGNRDKWLKEYPELVRYSETVLGATTGLSRHAGGVLVTGKDIEIVEDVGTLSIDGVEHPVSVIDKNWLEKANFVKMDILATNTIATIKEVSKLLEIPYPKTDDYDPNDEKVWKAIAEDNTGIFQFGTTMFEPLVKKMFSDETIQRIKENNDGRVDFLEMGSALTAYVRPGAASFREQAVKGVKWDNGCEPINEHLAGTMGYLAFQEDLMSTLNKFAGFTLAESDLARRMVAKKNKEDLDKLIPDIQKRMYETLTKEYDVSHEKATVSVEKFVQVMIDASDYSFNKAHSVAYTWIGFFTGYFREYHTLEWLAANLNVYTNASGNSGMKKKVPDLLSFAKRREIEVLKPRFGKSEIAYTVIGDSIGRGVDTMSGFNVEIAKYLSERKPEDYETFADFLLEVYDPAYFDAMKQYDTLEEIPEIEKYPGRVPMSRTQVSDLIHIGFFDDFEGDLISMLNIFKKPGKSSGGWNKGWKMKTRIARYLQAKAYVSSDEKPPVAHRLKKEFDLLKECSAVDPTMLDETSPGEYFFVGKTIMEGWSKSFEIHHIRTGAKVRAKSHHTMVEKLREGVIARIDNYHPVTTESGEIIMVINYAQFMEVEMK